MPHHKDIVMPKAAATADTLTRHFCTLFLHQFHAARENDDLTRVQTAILKTAAASGDRPEKVAGALVESGLRAGREGFPKGFISSLEEAKNRPGWNMNAATENQRSLMTFWQQRRPPTGYKRRARNLV